ncbi:hypothetical protein [Bosea sp. PAMC 26642]|uniref:hypothetical protein n=1 Tax=Bosea sp. (strain PAMC 26642) TaxID=1792307 RepID=UPI0012E82851|nr:hypothetical protein [Bosea sp. PAMC 26642]
MITDTRPLKNAIATAVSRLVSVREFGEASVVSVPVSYPSGALAAVHISVSGDRCFVSDCALGMREAEMSGASDFFDKAAKDTADWFGVGYDGASVFAASAPLDRIEGAIISVANASTGAVGRALLRASESKERHANSAVFDRVSDIFGRQNVARKQEIMGRDAAWEAHNIVVLNGKRAVFEFVGDHANAVANKFLMFSDLVRVADAPSLNSVVSSLAKISSKANMLGDVSHILEIGATSETFIQYARAA